MVCEAEGPELVVACASKTMLAALTRSARVRTVQAASPTWREARRHGSGGGGGLRPRPDFGGEPWPEQSWWNRVKFQQPGSNPLGDDMIGYEGNLGKYIAFMVGVCSVQFVWDKVSGAASSSH